jgi:hypothetical protein
MLVGFFIALLGCAAAKPTIETSNGNVVIT